MNRLDFKTGFAFIYYDDPESGGNAIRAMDGKELYGSALSVQHARDNMAAPKHIKRKNRLLLTNLNQRTSWQDLKGFQPYLLMISFPTYKI
jgi:RNA recognition motif-containing protein